MTWRDQIVVRILLLVARLFADDSELKLEIKNLANAIQAQGRELAREAAAAREPVGSAPWGDV